MMEWKCIRRPLQIFLLSAFLYAGYSSANMYSPEQAVENDDVGIVSQLFKWGAIEKEHMPDLLARAATHESERAARLLIEYGADINARDGADWTPLHFALIAHYPSRRAVNVAKLLIESGADVNVPTAAVGWTPLHLAAALKEPEVVEMLLAAGAEVNARTRFGGWTPLHMAERDNEGDSTLPHLEKRREQTVAMLRAAGAQADAYRENLHYYGMPVRGYVGGYSVTGSFTMADAGERLVFENLNVVKVIRLFDQHGTSRGVLVFNLDDKMTFERICLDPHTNTHSLMFMKGPHNRFEPDREAVFIHYDDNAGELTEVYADHYDWALELIDKSGACHWREKSEARSVFKETVAALSVGGESVFWYLDDDGIDDGVFVPLPNRVIPEDTVAAALETIENLPDDVAWVSTREYEESGRWKIVKVRGGHFRDRTKYGVMLVWDNTRKEWRSIFDGYSEHVFTIDQDKLFVSGYYGYCWNQCYEVDLATHRVREISEMDPRLVRYRERLR